MKLAGANRLQRGNRSTKSQMHFGSRWDEMFQKSLRLRPYQLPPRPNGGSDWTKTQQGVTAFKSSPTACGGLRWGQGGLNFPDSMRLGETSWDSCRANEPSSHSSYCLEESCRGDAVREPSWRC
jgi:hypothetical protein